MMGEDKPPIGVTPKVIWYELRIAELSRAIDANVKIGNFEQAYWWSLELTDILRCRERHIENSGNTISKSATFKE